METQSDTIAKKIEIKEKKKIGLAPHIYNLDLLTLFALWPLRTIKSATLKAHGHSLSLLLGKWSLTIPKHGKVVSHYFLQLHCQWPMVGSLDIVSLLTYWSHQKFRTND
jgi:hypothetical protein